MNGRGEHAEDWRDAYWWWFVGALLLLLPVDLLTTIVVIARHGVAAEGNPVMRWLLTRGLGYVLVANLVVAVLAVYLFSILIEVIRSAPAPHDTHLKRGVGLWLGLLVAVGVVTVGNNLAALIHGESLVGVG